MNKIIPSFFLILSALCILLAGCDINSTFRNKDIKPSLSEDKLVAVLTDIQLAEAVLKDNILKRDSFNFETAEQYYSTIFTIHEIGQQSFDQTMDYYVSHPLEMEGLYNKVESKFREYITANNAKAKNKVPTPKLK